MSKLFDYALTQVSADVKQYIDNSMDIANQIHMILERQGKTQRQLAELLGKKESEISRWLSGSHNFTLKSISRIEVILGEKIILTPNHRWQMMQMLKSALPVKRNEGKADKAKTKATATAGEETYAMAA